MRDRDQSPGGPTGLSNGGSGSGGGGGIGGAGGNQSSSAGPYHRRSDSPDLDSPRESRDRGGGGDRSGGGGGDRYQSSSSSSYVQKMKDRGDRDRDYKKDKYTGECTSRWQ